MSRLSYLLPPKEMSISSYRSIALLSVNSSSTTTMEPDRGQLDSIAVRVPPAMTHMLACLKQSYMLYMTNIPYDTPWYMYHTERLMTKTKARAQ